jgi:hypothetical protein
MTGFCPVSSDSPKGSTPDSRIFIAGVISIDALRFRKKGSAAIGMVGGSLRSNGFDKEIPQSSF